MKGGHRVGQRRGIPFHIVQRGEAGRLLFGVNRLFLQHDRPAVFAEKNRGIFPQEVGDDQAHDGGGHHNHRPDLALRRLSAIVLDVVAKGLEPLQVRPQPLGVACREVGTDAGQPFLDLLDVDGVAALAHHAYRAIGQRLEFDVRSDQDAVAVGRRAAAQFLLQQQQDAGVEVAHGREDSTRVCRAEVLDADLDRLHSVGEKIIHGSDMPDGKTRRLRETPARIVAGSFRSLADAGGRLKRPVYAPA